MFKDITLSNCFTIKQVMTVRSPSSCQTSSSKWTQNALKTRPVWACVRSVSPSFTIFWMRVFNMASCNDIPVYFPWLNWFNLFYGYCYIKQRLILSLTIFCKSLTNFSNFCIVAMWSPSTKHEIRRKIITEQ